jgi:DNA-binding response OmpR family regulator
MNILLVEDNQILGEALRDHMLASGHMVDWQTSFADGLRASQIAGHDLVLLDLRLPDGDGLCILRAIRRSQRILPIIILTAYDRLSDLIEGLTSGANDYLVKPFNLSDLVDRVERVVTHLA